MADRFHLKNNGSIGSAGAPTAITIAQTGLVTISNGITATGAVTGGSITDGTASFASGALSGVTTINATGAVTGGSVTDGTATLSSGALSDVLWAGT